MKTVVIGVACAELNYLEEQLTSDKDVQIITVEESKELPAVFSQQAKRLTKKDRIFGYNFYPNQATAFKNQLKFAECKAHFTNYTDWVNGQDEAGSASAIGRLVFDVGGKSLANEIDMLRQSSIWRYRHTLFGSHYESFRKVLGADGFNKLIEYNYNRMSQQARFLLNCIDRVGTTYFNTSLKYQSFLWDYVKQENATLVTIVLTDRLARIEIQTPNRERLHALASKVSANYTSNQDRAVFFGDNSLNQLETLFANAVTELDFKHAHPDVELKHNSKETVKKAGKQNE